MQLASDHHDITGLAECRHRTDITETDCACGSNWLVHGGRVSLAVCSRCPYVDRPNRDIVREKKRKQVAPADGAGTVLRRLLNTLGIVSRKDCECAWMASEMNRNGCEWCIENASEIVAHMKKAAKKRHIPYSALVAHGLVRLSVRIARRRNWCDV